MTTGAPSGPLVMAEFTVSSTWAGAVAATHSVENNNTGM